MFDPTFSATTCSSSLTRDSKPVSEGSGITNLDDHIFFLYGIFSSLDDHMFFSGSFFSLDVHMFASYDRLVKFSSALLMSSKFYLFVGDAGFELRPCPSREDLREELDKSEFDYYNVDGDDVGDFVEDHVDGDDDGDDDQDNLDESEFDPDFDEFPDFEGGETPDSVIAKPECFMTQDKRNTSSRSPWC